MKLIASILFCLLSIFVSAANPFKEAREALKTGRNLDAAEKSMAVYAVAETTPPSERSYALNLAAQLARKSSLVDNENMYLKRGGDTVRYFGCLQRMADYIIRCDSIENLPDERGRMRFTFRKKNRKMINRYRTNLLEGGKWFMNHGKHAEAVKMFVTYHKCDTDCWQIETDRNRISYWIVVSAYASGNMSAVLDYWKNAQAYGHNPVQLLRYKLDALYALGDMAQWELVIKSAIDLYPCEQYFVLTYIDHLRKQRLYAEAIALCHKVLRKCSDTVNYNYALALCSYDVRDSDACIAASDKVITALPDHAVAHFFKGMSYLSKALDTNNKVEARELYVKARQPLEVYRRLRPEHKDKWAPALFKVYYALNMGAELAEIETILK